MKEMLGGCSVCCDETGWAENPLVYCDGPNCNVAVHQGKFVDITSGFISVRSCHNNQSFVDTYLLIFNFWLRFRIILFC